MKTCIFIFSLFFCFITNAQGIVTVNNNTDFPADYDDLQTAIDEVDPGTVLLVAGSGINYGAITLDKQLAIYGPGYFLGDNEEPWTQASTSQASTNDITFNEGSSGSYIAGLYVLGTTYIGTISNLTLENNRLQNIFSINGTTPSNITIQGNYLNSNDFRVNNASGVVFRNNILNTTSGAILFAYSSSGISGLVIENNIVRSSANSTSVYAFSANFSNNICIHNGNTEWNLNSAHLPSVVNNNISTDAALLANYPNNLSEADPSEVFIDWDNPGLYSNDYIYTLAADSPAIGYGTNGEDAGPFSGTNPYTLSGIPNIPHIYYLDVPTAGSAQDGLQIHVKAKANN